MSSSESDMDWLRPPSQRTTTSAGGASNEAKNVMMLARQEALRRQREVAVQKKQPKPEWEAEGGSAAKAAAASPEPASKLESSLPDFLLDSDEGPTQQAAPAPSVPGGAPPAHATNALRASVAPSNAAAGASGGDQNTPPAPAPAPPTKDRYEINEERIQELRRELEAKTRLLQSKREKETAWMEKWRADKAQKQAEIRQLETKINAVKRSLDEEKSRAENELSVVRAKHDREMQEARQRIEQGLKNEFEPQIAELQSKLTTLRQEEAELRAQIEGSTAASDLVGKAMAGAVKVILADLNERFLKDSSRNEQWIRTVEELVRREIRSSLAVTADSEVDLERDQYKKNFDELLEFWEQAEEEVRRRIEQVDQVLLSDVESMLREDLARLQKEQLGIEEIYVESHNAWAAQHEAMLQAEVEAIIQRREAELAEYRKLRDQIHVERLAHIERCHKERTDFEAHMHKTEMEQLRKRYTEEERLNEERQRVAVAAHQDIAKATESFQGIVTSMEGVLTALKEYRAGVDERRLALESDQREAVAKEEKMLESAREVAASLCSALDGEWRSLGEAASKLQLAQEQMEQLMRSERAWLAEQETSYRKDKENWEREYRRWKTLVKQEQDQVKERFYETLSQLQDSVAKLSSEKREIEAQSAATKRTFAEMEASVARDLAELQEKQQELQSRKDSLNATLAMLDKEAEETAQQWDALKEQRNALSLERDNLRKEELKLQEMSHTLSLAKVQCDAVRAETVASAQRDLLLKSRPLAKEGAVVKPKLVAAPALEALEDARGGASPAHMDPSALLPHPHHPHATSKNKKNRLPQRTIKELKQHLQSLTEFSNSLQLGAPLNPSSFITPAAVATAKKMRPPAPAPAAAPAPHKRKKETLSSLCPEGSKNAPVFTPEQRTRGIHKSAQQRSNGSTAQTEHRSSMSYLTDISGIASSSEAHSFVDTFTNLVSFSDGDTTLHSYPNP